MRNSRLSPQPTTALALALCCAALPAQTQNIAYVPNNNAATGTMNAYPFGFAGVRVQQLIPQSVLGSNPALIQDLFVVPTITASTSGPMEREVSYEDFEIRMGLTTLSTLTNNWTTNSPNPTIVHRGPLRVRFLRGQWVPLGLPASYAWQPTGPGDNLVVEFINRSTLPGMYLFARAGGISRAHRYDWVSSQLPPYHVDNSGVKLGILLDDGNFVVHGGGCPGSSTLSPWIGIKPGTWPQIGSPLDLRLTQGPPSLAAVLMLGFNTEVALGLPLPLDLAVYGAPGCFAWNDPIVMSPFVPTDAAGDGALILNIANQPAFLSLRVYGTWLCIDPLANPLGVTTSGFGTIILGT